MATDAFIRQSRGNFTGDIGSTDVTPGDLVYFDGSDWELADADDEGKFAEAMVVRGGKAVVTGAAAETQTAVLSTSAILKDLDDPFTQGAQLYLSGTPGQPTATRPTGNDDLKQVVGFALSTSEVRIEIGMPHEVSVYVPLPVIVANAAADRDNDFGGLGLPTANDEALGTVQIPDNCVGIKIAKLWWTGTGTALDTNDTYTIDCSSGIDDETTSANADGIAAAALTVAANDIASADVTAAMDLAAILEPGALMGIAVKKAAEGSGGDDPIICGVNIVFLVV